MIRSIPTEGTNHSRARTVGVSSSDMLGGLLDIVGPHDCSSSFPCNASVPKSHAEHPKGQKEPEGVDQPRDAS